MNVSLRNYREIIALDRRFEHPPVFDAQAFDAALKKLLNFLLQEAEDNSRFRLSASHTEIENLRALLTCRSPAPFPAHYLALNDRLLQTLKSFRHLTDFRDLPTIADVIPHTSYAAADICALWQGDITNLEIDGIVNAANEKLLGCFIPFHACIDNAIHWLSGPQLRADCNRIIEAQGGEDQATGEAKITRGYNLPARFVLHTVGPIVTGQLTEHHRQALARCYISCLELAAQAGLRSLAFCAISTGVFGFPRQPAARVATETVASWLAEHPGYFDLIVFNVFSQEDETIYRNVFETTHE